VKYDCRDHFPQHRHPALDAGYPYHHPGWECHQERFGSPGIGYQPIRHPESMVHSENWKGSDQSDDHPSDRNCQILPNYHLNSDIHVHVKADRNSVDVTKDLYDDSCKIRGDLNDDHRDTVAYYHMTQGNQNDLPRHMIDSLGRDPRRDRIECHALVHENLECSLCEVGRDDLRIRHRHEN